MKIGKKEISDMELEFLKAKTGINSFRREGSKFVAEQEQFPGHLIFNLVGMFEHKFCVVSSVNGKVRIEC